MLGHTLGKKTMMILCLAFASALAVSDAPLPAHCQAAVDAFCASSCYPLIKSRPCDGPMTARSVSGAPHGDGYKCYSPSCLNANFTRYVGGGCFCSDANQILAVLEANPGCAPPAPTPAPIPFSFAKAHGDGMVLAAAPKQAMVWGFCAPGATVQVSLDGGASIAATVGPDQATGVLTTWRAKLPPTAAGFDNHTVTATATTTTSSGDGEGEAAATATAVVALSGVLFGEVWVCSGQSNMQYPIGSAGCWNASNVNCTAGGAQCSFGCSQDAGRTIADMPAYDGGMRLFNVGGGSDPTPQPDMHSGTGWKTPSAMGGAFSAVCWFYGRDIYNALSPKVPVGLISTYVGGTPIEHWTSPAGIKACEGPNSWDFPPGKIDSVLWNAMVVPLLRTVHSGVAWYQGENNAANPRQYNCAFPAMISDWRAQWAAATDGATDAAFPFGWAQINSCGVYGCGGGGYKNPIFNPAKPPSDCGEGCAPECSTACLGRFHEWADYGNGFTGIRYAQSNALSLPNTFQAVIIDTPLANGAIHSPFKQPAGRRLARGGLAVAYGNAAAHAVDPVVSSATLSADGKSVTIAVGGLGSAGLVAVQGADAFEVLGACDPQPANGTCTADVCLCWVSTPIALASKTTVTLLALPAQPQAVRYLWYISPYSPDGRHLMPFKAPVYAPTNGDIPGAVPIPGGDDMLPLGPFVLPLK